jgi:hemerythrin
MLAEWSTEYETGIDKIDQQHKQFFAIVKRLHEECMAGKGKKVVESTLAFLRNYALQHFEDEQAFMQRHNYPRMERHMALHDEFLESYDALMDDLDDFGPSEDLAKQTAEMIEEWLIHHIMEADMDYAQYVKTLV